MASAIQSWLSLASIRKVDELFPRWHQKKKEAAAPVRAKAKAKLLKIKKAELKVVYSHERNSPVTHLPVASDPTALGENTQTISAPGRVSAAP